MDKKFFYMLSLQQEATGKPIPFEDLKRALGGKHPSSTEDNIFQDISVKFFKSRFVFIYWNEGKLKPRAKTVKNVSTNTERDNPRKKNEVEVNRQTFFLIDSEKDSIYISDIRKKKKLSEWLKKELNVSVILKEYFDKAKFFNGIKTLDNIKLHYTPEELNKHSTLSDKYTYDPFGFGGLPSVKGVKIELSLNSVGGSVFKKILLALKKSVDENDSTPVLNKLQISGRDKNEVLKILDIDKVVNKLHIDIEKNKEGLYAVNQIHSKLIEKITETEED